MIELEIKSKLESVCPNKVFLSIAPLGTPPPYLCYGLISAVHNDVLGGQSGKVQYTLQIDIYSSLYSEITELTEKVLEKLLEIGVSNINYNYFYEDDTNLYHESIEFEY